MQIQRNKQGPNFHNFTWQCPMAIMYIITNIIYILLKTKQISTLFYSGKYFVVVVNLLLLYKYLNKPSNITCVLK